MYTATKTAAVSRRPLPTAAGLGYLTRNLVNGKGLTATVKVAARAALAARRTAAAALAARNA